MVCGELDTRGIVEDDSNIDGSRDSGIVGDI